MEVVITDRQYQVVMFDPQGFYRREGRNKEESGGELASLIMRLHAQALFWSCLVAVGYRCRDEWGDIDAVASAIAHRPMPSPTKPLDVVIEQFFPILKREYARTKSRLQKLALAHRFLRYEQLTQIHCAVDAVVLFEPRRELESILLGSDLSEEALGNIRQKMCALYREIIPRAIALLWLWKTEERFRPSTDYSQPDINVLWTAVLKLRAATDLSYDATFDGADDSDLGNSYDPLDEIRKCSLEQIECVLPKNRNPLLHILRKPVIDYNLREMWTILRKLSWQWPYITPGRMVHRFLDAAWLRIALLCSSASTDATVMNYVALRREVPQSTPRRWCVNSHFIDQTERIMFYMFDSLWTVQWFVRQKKKTINATPTTATFDATGLDAPWSEALRRHAAGSSSEFIKLEFSKTIWRMNSCRDDIERYNIDTNTRQGDPRRAIGYYHKPEYDILLPLANAMPSSIIGPAIEALQEDWLSALDWRKKHDEAFYRPQHGASIVECAWRSAADLKNGMAASDTLQSENKGKANDEDNLEFRVEVNAAGETIYIDKRSGTKLRGEKAVAAAALYSFKTLQVGKAEYDAVNHETLKNLILSQPHQASPMLYVVSDVADDLRLDVLPRDHATGLLPAKPDRPSLLRVANQYFVYDGRETLAHTIFLCQALRIWCLEVDKRIECELNKIGKLAELVIESYDLKSSRNQIKKLYSKAVDAVMSIPQPLREIFGPKRDKETLALLELAKPPWYNETVKKAMVDLDIWPKLKERELAAARQGTSSARASHKMLPIHQW